MLKKLLSIALAAIALSPTIPARAETSVVAAIDPPAETAPASGKRIVYILPVEGMIEPALLYVLRRGITEANDVGADAIVLRMNTLGGRLDAATEIVRLLQSVDVPTYTWVEKDAISAGAIISLATAKIYMAPGSVIGDAMPVMMSPVGGAPQDMPEDLQEKTVSAVSAMIRATAQKSGHDPQLAEAMVRREVEYKIGDEVISPEGQLLTLTNVEAEREVGPPDARRRLLSAGTVDSIDALLEEEGLADAERRTLEVTSSERIARYIAAAAPLLLMAGLLGLYIEFKTPGFGIPGLLGILALALFFWGHHIAGLAGKEDLLLFFLGVVLIALEIFVIPGFGIPGLLGIGLVLTSLLNAMAHRLPGGSFIPSLPDLQGPAMNLSLAILLSALGAVVAARFLPKTPLYGRLVLQGATTAGAGYTSGPPRALAAVGDLGVASTALRPGGAMRIGDHTVDVVSRGGFIDAGRKVRVAEVHGMRIVVDPADGEA